VDRTAAPKQSRQCHKWPSERVHRANKALSWKWERRPRLMLHLRWTSQQTPVQWRNNGVIAPCAIIFDDRKRKSQGSQTLSRVYPISGVKAQSPRLDHKYSPSVASKNGAVMYGGLNYERLFGPSPLAAGTISLPDGPSVGIYPSVLALDPLAPGLYSVMETSCKTMNLTCLMA
jgi:hypothetical protein